MNAAMQPIRSLLYAQLLCAIFISMTAFIMSELGARESYRHMGTAIPVVSGFVSALVVFIYKNKWRSIKITFMLSIILQFIILAFYSFLSGERLGPALKVGDGILSYAAILAAIYLLILYAIYALFLLSRDKDD